MSLETSKSPQYAGFVVWDGMGNTPTWKKAFQVQNFKFLMIHG